MTGMTMMSAARRVLQLRRSGDGAVELWRHEWRAELLMRRCGGRHPLALHHRVVLERVEEFGLGRAHLGQQARGRRAWASGQRRIHL